MSILKEMLLEESMTIQLDSTFDDLKQEFGSVDKLSPTLSESNVEFHLNTLTKGYFDKFEETGSPFAYCGARLHDLWWKQFGEDKGDAEEVVQLLGYESTKLFVEAIQSAAETIQGNGWVVVTKDAIVPISNHSFAGFDNIVLLIDLWEHSYQIDYKGDKKTYISNTLLKAISWNDVKNRL